MLDLDHVCDTRPTHDPATVKGFLYLLAAWAWGALKLLAHGKLPRLPQMRTVYTLPLHSGGEDHRYGVMRGGPQVFGGPRDSEVECLRGEAPLEFTRVVVRNGRMYRVGWVLRRPSEYRYERPKSRWRTSSCLAAITEA